MVRKLTSAILVAGALNATHASALGLGEFRLNSALNQPLKAEIQLLNVGDLSEDQILINIGDNESFENAGVERDFFLTNLQFVVEVDGEGNGVVKVSTRKLVNEPYLDFVVEARWPAGRLLREYTVLLDLPVYSEENSTTVQLSSGADSTATVVLPDEKPKTVVSTTAAPRSPIDSGGAGSPSTSASPEQSYRVRKSDTLWKIAEGVRPNDEVSIQQTMLALHAANPSAFIDGNINLLKAGQVLRIPDQGQIASVSHRAAMREIARQNEDWRKGRGPAPLEASDRAPSPAVTPPAQEGRLKLTAAVESDSDSAQAGDSSIDDSGDLNEQLTLSQAQLEQAEAENQELRDSLSKVQQELETLRQSVDLKSDDMAKLSAAMGDAADTDEQAEPAPDAESLAPNVSDAVRKAAEPPPKPGIIDRLVAQPLYLGGALVVLLGLVVLMLKRRSSAVEPLAAAPVVGSSRVEESDNEPHFGDESEFVTRDSDALMEEVNAEPAGQESVPQEVVTTELETGDPIGEADIYVAYGRYQHAADLLLNAIDGEPQRTDYRLKLLEVYLEAEDRDGFRRQFSALQELGEESAIGRAKDMLSSVDSAVGWLDNLQDVSSSAVAADFSEELDASDFEDDTVLTEAVEESLVGGEGDDDILTSEMDELALDDLTEDDALSDESADFELELEDEPGSDEQDAESLVSELDSGEMNETDEELTGFDLDLDFDTADVTDESEQASADYAPDDEDDLGSEPEVELEIELDLEDNETLAAESEPTETVVDSGELESGLGDLDMEFDELDALEQSASVADVDATLQRDAITDLDDDLDFVSEADEIATKLDLARAYIDMGDVDGAKDILSEVMEEGEEKQKAEASELLSQIA